MTSPPELPKVPRNDDGTMNGQQAMFGILDLYSVAGAIRLQLLGLIEAEKAHQSQGSN